MVVNFQLVWPVAISFPHERLIWLLALNVFFFFFGSKIIGARYYPSSEAGNYTTRDIENHGTCTSSTTGGNEVKDVSFFRDWGQVLKEVVFLWQELRYIKSYASADGVAVMTISIGHAHSLNIRDESIYDDLKFCWQ